MLDESRQVLGGAGTSKRSGYREQKHPLADENFIRGGGAGRAVFSELEKTYARDRITRANGQFALLLACCKSKSRP